MTKQLSNLLPRSLTSLSTDELHFLVKRLRAQRSVPRPTSRKLKKEVAVRKKKQTSLEDLLSRLSPEELLAFLEKTS